MVVWRVFSMAVMGWPMSSHGNEATKRAGAGEGGVGGRKGLVLEDPACRRRKLGHSSSKF